MNVRSFTAVALAFACASATPLRVCAQVPASANSPAPVPSGSPAGVNDPCTSLSNLVSRPTVTPSACAVKPDGVLLENGYTNLTLGARDGSNLSSLPQNEIRAGLFRNFEIDVETPTFEHESAGPGVSGDSDPGIGFKYEVGYTSKMTYAVLFLETLGNGSPAFSSNGTGVLANLDATLTLSPALGLFSTVGYNAQNAGTVVAPTRYHGINPSLGATLSLPLALNFFCEGFGETVTGAGLGGHYGFDLGFTRDLGSRLQLDAEYYDWPNVQYGVHQSSLGFGASYLFGR